MVWVVAHVEVIVHSNERSYVCDAITIKMNYIENIVFNLKIAQKPNTNY